MRRSPPKCLLQVTAALDSPVAGNSPLNLDGVVTSVRTRHRSGGPQRSQPLGRLKRHRGVAFVEYGRVPVYLASDMIFTGVVEMGRMVGRSDGEDLEILTRSKRAAGPQKDIYRPVRLRTAGTVTWLVVGNRQLIRRALKEVSAVGAYRGQGYGRVSGWLIEEVEGDVLSPWVGEGCLRRSMPADWVDGPADPVLLPVSPPYWHRDHLVPAHPAGTEGVVTARVRAEVCRVADIA